MGLMSVGGGQKATQKIQVVTKDHSGSSASLNFYGYFDEKISSPDTQMFVDYGNARYNTIKIHDVAISYDGQNWILTNSGDKLTVESGLPGSPIVVESGEQIYKWVYTGSVNIVMTR